MIAGAHYREQDYGILWVPYIYKAGYGREDLPGRLCCSADEALRIAEDEIQKRKKKDVK